MRHAMRAVWVGVAVSLLGGCMHARPTTVLTAGHPAADESEEAPFVPPANPFAAATGAAPEDGPGDGMAGTPGMKHTPAPGGDRGSDATDKVIYTCPMHADVRSDAAGECPKCGMKLVPAKPGDAQSHDHGGVP